MTEGQPRRRMSPDEDGAASATPEAEVRPKIQIIEQRMGLSTGRHEDNWSRKTNITGRGATHVRSFNARMSAESIEFMDAQINDWLDKHPDYEVKFVTTTIGEWQGKLGKEPHLIMHIWV